MKTEHVDHFRPTSHWHAVKSKSTFFKDIAELKNNFSDISITTAS